MLRVLFIFIALGLSGLDCAPRFGPGKAFAEPLYRNRDWQRHLEMMRLHQAGEGPPPPAFRLPGAGRKGSFARSSAAVSPARGALAYSSSAVGAERVPAPAGLRQSLGGAPPPGWDHLIEQAGRANNLDPLLLSAVIRAESDFNARAVSSRGALGAMQIMPATARKLGLKNFFDPKANIHAGARYLAELRGRFTHPALFLAAYNAGPGAVSKYGGIPPYAETRRFVSRVLNFWRPGPAAGQGNTD